MKKRSYFSLRKRSYFSFGQFLIILFLGIIFTIIGGITYKYYLSFICSAFFLVLLIDLILFLKSNIRTREINKLIKNGNKVQGIITQIVNSGGWTGNNRAFFYKLIVTSPNSNSSVSQTFISDKVTDFNPLSLEKNNQIPVPIDVYIDKVNPKKYYVDISQLPSKSNNILSQNLTLSYDNKNNSLIIDLEK